MEEDILVGEQEKKKIIALLRRTPFENFEIHPHYYNIHGLPRHGVDIAKAKSIYSCFDKITAVQKRPAKSGFKYGIIYRLSKRNSYYLLFFLDEKPMKLFNAYFSGESVEKRLLRKYFGR